MVMSLHLNILIIVSDNTHEHFVLYTDPYHKQVYQTSLSDTTLTTQGIPGPLMDYPISADYDTGKGRVFWIDQSRGEFRRTTVADGAEDAIRTFAAGITICLVTACIYHP